MTDTPLPGDRPKKPRSLITESIYHLLSVGARSDSECDADIRFVIALAKELARARGLHGDSQGMLAALTEECGEVAKAMLDESAERVYEEAVQTAVAALRLATEGDRSLNSYRRRKNLEML